MTPSPTAVHWSRRAAEGGVMRRPLLLLEPDLLHQRGDLAVVARQERVELPGPAQLDDGAHPGREVTELRALRGLREGALEPRQHRLRRALRRRDAPPERH